MSKKSCLKVYTGHTLDLRKVLKSSKRNRVVQDVNSSVILKRSGEAGR